MKSENRKAYDALDVVGFVLLGLFGLFAWYVISVAWLNFVTPDLEFSLSLYDLLFDQESLRKSDDSGL